VFDTSLRLPMDVQQKLNLPLLGAIPDMPAGAETERPERAQAGEPVAAVQGA
jgi:hypothetical protein